MSEQGDIIDIDFYSRVELLFVGTPKGGEQANIRLSVLASKLIGKRSVDYLRVCVEELS
ncbi:MAG: hypothetical protein WCE81_06960 [Halobacteriota archaeon]